MIFLLSPAKKLVCQGVSPKHEVTEPVLMQEAEYLAKKLKAKSASSLMKMMGISKDLGQLNHERYQMWSNAPRDDQAMQAALLFQGDVYQGLQAADFNKKQMKYAQSHLRILSGLYGILRPLDKTMPYRLEMGSDFKVTPAKSNLYKFWGDRIRKEVSTALGQHDEAIVVNLASNEYARAAQLNKLDTRIVTPEFREEKDGDYKMISFFAKKARGLMARYAVEHNIRDVESLKGFDSAGYYYNNELSQGDKWVFTRLQK